MRRLVRAFRHHNHVDHISGEAEAVAELLDREHRTDHEQARGLRDRQIHEYNIGQIHRGDHGPQETFQTIAGNNEAAQNAAQGQRDYSNRPINNPHLLRREPKPANRPTIEEKGRD